jgi:hypothetical protein
LVLGLATCAAVELLVNARGAQHGLDFHGIWRAGRDVLLGRSPYITPGAKTLLLQSNAFVTPPVLAELAVPFSLLPFTLAIVLWNMVCVMAFVCALKLAGVSDRRALVVGLCSFPFLASIDLGQPDGVFALGVALAWRWRDSWRGAVAIGAVIAAKLLVWPLIIWLLVTRRVRLAAIAGGSALALLAASWAAIGFNGLSQYPRLLAADAQAFEARSHSIVAAAMRLGISEHPARLLTVVLAVALALTVARGAQWTDLGWFTGMLLAGLLLSPVLWSHYLVILLIPLALSCPRLSLLWGLTALFWISPLEPPSTDAQVIVVLVTAAAIALLASARAIPSSRFPPRWSRSN